MTTDEVYDQMDKEFSRMLKSKWAIRMHLYKIFQKAMPYTIPFIESRIKTTKSVAYKVEQLKSPPKSIIDIHDIIGIRFICLTPKIVEEVVQIIKSELTINKEYNTKTRLDETQFGYSSIHLIGKISKEDNEIINEEKEYDFEGLKYEIQIRTISEHIFAALSHKNSYKTGKFIKSEIKRPLFRIAALSEVIDNEIENFEEARNKHIEAENLDPNDQISIENLMLFLPKIIDSKRDTGLNEPYDDLVRDLFAFNIKSLKDLGELVKKNYKEFRRLELKKIEVLKSKLKEKHNDNLQNLVVQNFIYGFTGTIRGIMNQEFKTEWQKYNEEYVQKPMWEKLRQMAEQLSE